MQPAKTEAHAKAREQYITRKQAKLDSADARKADRASRSDVFQLALLDQRLGKGVGAKRERARLQARIDAASKPKKKKEFASKSEERRVKRQRKAKERSAK